MAQSDSKDLLIYGPGRLGSRVGGKWLQARAGNQELSGARLGRVRVRGPVNRRRTTEELSGYHGQRRGIPTLGVWESSPR